VWASNERRADVDITDHRPPHALAPQTTVNSGVGAWSRVDREIPVDAPGAVTELRRHGHVRDDFATS
jgi:hypothetical protein